MDKRISYGSSHTVTYARGFPGSADKAVSVEREATRTSFPTIFGSNAKSVRVTVNPEIMRSYEQLVRGDMKAQSFDFKERVIREACNAFGCTSFNLWVQALVASNAISQTHINFVEDLLSFALYGNERKLPVQTWDSLIQIQSRGSELLDIPGNVQSLIGTALYQGGLVRDVSELSIPTLINRWLSRPTGFSDMVVTLNTMFGDQPFHL